jgi:hypothetical protein
VGEVVDFIVISGREAGALPFGGNQKKDFNFFLK